MKKIITGKGHLGSYLAAHYTAKGDNVIHWTHNIDDLSLDLLGAFGPAVIINTAGKTDLVWCENNAVEAFQNNVKSPLELYRRCSRLGYSFIQISSGCIWDGPFTANGRPFEPTDPITPACFYAWTKASCDSLLLDELYIHEWSPTLLIIRPRQVYSPILSHRNTLSKLRQYKGLLNTPNSMTSADTIIKTIDVMLTEKNYWPCTLSVYDKGYSTPYQVGKLLHEAGLRAEPTLLEKSDMDQWHKPKRVDAVLYDCAFETLVNPPKIEDELKRVIAEYAKNA